MYDIDKTAFAGFLTQLRKERGWTQKELAERLYISDKAVSKWERALSLPDISLLIPLAKALGVTVTELLEGKRMEHPQTMAPEEVERLVKTAVRLGGEEGNYAEKKRRALVFAGILAASALLWTAALLLMRTPCVTEYHLLLFSVLAAIFGGYAWIFMKERLPDYYDENRISFYGDGLFRMNLPGVRFQNRTWPGVLKALRLWSAATLLAAPVISFLTAWLALDVHNSLWFQMAVLFAYLGGLFLPIYFAAREQRGEKPPAGKRRKLTLLVLMLLIPLLWLSSGMETSYGTMELGYVSSSDSQSWSARYARFSGTKIRTIHPKEGDYVLTVETEEGSLAVEIQDETGTVFSRGELPTGRYPVTLTGKSKITLRAEKHRGSFSIRPQ